MHEASLMKNMLAIVEKAAADAGGGRVTVIQLRRGEMAGVQADAMRFAFDVMSKGTAAEGATLEIETVPLRVRCKRCGAEAHPEDFVFICMKCGATEIEIIGGREMEVDHILLEEAGRNAGGAGA